MLEKQSLDEFLSHCRNSEEQVVVSVSPQSRASLAAFFNLSPTQVLCSTRVVYSNFLFPKCFEKHKRHMFPQKHQGIKFVPARYLPYIIFKKIICIIYLIYIQTTSNVNNAYSSSSAVRIKIAPTFCYFESQDFFMWYVWISLLCFFVQHDIFKFCTGIHEMMSFFF